MKILILASNPRKDLNLDREIRDLQGVIERSRNREQFEIEIGLAVRVGDLQELLLKHRPQIVHFCGHGSGEQGLVFESDEGGEQWVRADALSNLFKLFADSVECVLLNACYSEEQAEAVVNHVDYVVGMRQEIRDDAAIAFTKGFYRALGYECSVEQSYDFGCNAIQLEISGSSRVRSIVPQEQRKLEVKNVIQKTVIPEHLKPVLKKKQSLSTSEQAASTSTKTLSPEAQLNIQLDVEEALVEEKASQKEYRERARSYLADHKLENYESIFLSQLRNELGLSAEEANRILEQEKLSVQRAHRAYANRLTALIQGGCYPFNEAIERELRNFQTQEKLTDDEVQEISKPILEKVEHSTQPSETDDLSSERDVDYRRLRDLLFMGEWRAADQETAKRMCEAMQRQQQSYLRPIDIQLFPCIDLRTIDRLWVTYSMNKFGFSIQRKIWQECGCPTSFDRDWKKFSSQVGWLLDVADSPVSRQMDDDISLATIISNLIWKKKRWITYDEISFNTSAPLGQLPITAITDDFTAVGSQIDVFLTLFSRLKGCKL